MSQPHAKHWQRALELLQQQQVPAAIQQLHALWAIDPGGMRPHVLAARIHWHEGRMREAAEQALAAAEATADDPAVLVDVIKTLRMVGETARAHEMFQRGTWEATGSPDQLYRNALLCQGFGAYERALALFDELSAGAPETGNWHFFRGQQLEFMGRFEDAEDAYETCLETSPGFGYAAYKLVRLRPQTESDNRLRMIDSGLPHVQPRTSGRADFEFARYHVLEDLGKLDQAWHVLESANAAMLELGLADIAAEEAQLRHFTARMAALSIPIAGATPPGPCPIFIIGMPRSGTTLLERMLANHSQIAGAGELTDFGLQLLRVLGHRDLLGEHSSSSIATLDSFEVGRRYLAQTAWRARGKPYYVDKLPSNWMFVGSIRAALPQAKILHLVRDPMNTCFSVWRARFADGHSWSYQQDALAAYFRSCRGMMRHWKQLYPDTICEVDYSALVQNPAATLRDLLAFCGIQWEPGCEDPSRNPAPVSTLSSTQVRSAVNTHGLDRWRRYEKPLEPLQRKVSAP